MYCRKYTQRNYRTYGQPFPLSGRYHRNDDFREGMAETELKLGRNSGSLRGIQFDGSYVLPCNEKGKRSTFITDAVVLTGGLINGKVGNTNVIKVETVK